MADTTTKLALPFIIAAQAQKEVTHNEALIALDVYVQLVVEDRDLNSPPAAPGNGQVWLVAAPAGGDWTGQEAMLAQYQEGIWRFYAPFPGMSAWLKDEAVPLRHDGSQWVSGGSAALGPAAPAIADPAGGSMIDTEARAALISLLQALRSQNLIAG